MCRPLRGAQKSPDEGYSVFAGVHRTGSQSDVSGKSNFELLERANNTWDGLSSLNQVECG